MLRTFRFLMLDAFESGRGNQQNVVLAKWMYSEPDRLIIDEPSRSIDVGAKYEIYGTINEFADQGKGLIGISSEIPKFRGISGPIYALSEFESPWTCRARTRRRR